MRFLNIVKSAENSPLGPPPKALMDAIAKLGEDATKAGVFVETGGLLPSAAGARLGAVARRAARRSRGLPRSSVPIRPAGDQGRAAAEDESEQKPFNQRRQRPDDPLPRRERHGLDGQPAR